MKRFYLSALFIVASYFSFSQHSSIAYKKLADSLYRDHNYQNAAVYYEKAIKKSTEPGVVMLQIAKSYSNLNKPIEAEHWFEEARNHHAHLSDEDMYLYIRALLSLQKREQAEEELTTLLNDTPNDVFAKQTLDDLHNFKKYYKDSLSNRVSSLPINTTVAEFGPALYKEGIVFSFAQPQNFLKKKYHYDNSNFLTLYYSAKVNGVFQKPVIFDENLNSDFHDGPASFYADGEKMIINKNELHKGENKKTTPYYYLALYDAQRVDGKWQLNLLPFNEPPYSMAHPSISPDGNVLYFVSNKPGGYGGTDVYRAERKYGAWTTPFNLGPTVNTFGDEVFPFFLNGTLFFGSNGHGGLGGLDIFKSEKTKNGFTQPVNLGFPINSNFDDFGFITALDEETGFFSSARTGNDDLYTFQKNEGEILMLANIFDGQTKEPLAGAIIQLISDTGNDQTLAASDDGLIKFSLPKKSNFVLIGTKDDKSGMQSGVAIPEEDQLHVTHPIPAFGDTTRIPCVGLIKNELGLSENPSKVTIIDENTGKKISYDQHHPMVSFLGEKGHDYRIEIENEKGDTTVQAISISPSDKNSKTWTMVLKQVDQTMNMAARVLKESDQSTMAGATVKVMTFSEEPKELHTNEEGLIEFPLKEGEAYTVIATKDGLTGMYSGIANDSTDKDAIIHSITTATNLEQDFPMMGLITDNDGNLLKDAKVTITELPTGKKIEVQATNGVISFFAHKETEYVINVEHDKYQPAAEHFKTPAKGTNPDKLSISLQDKKNDALASLSLAARIFKVEDNQSLIRADVTITSFTEPDISLLSDNEGLVDYSLPKGTSYIIIGNKDGYTGVFAGVAEDGMDKASIIHPVPTINDAGKHLPVIALITDKQGNALEAVNVSITDKSTNEKLPVSVTKGLVNFFGEKGKDYTITVAHKDFKPATALISIPTITDAAKKVSILLDGNELSITTPKNLNNNTVPIIASVTNTKGIPLNDATVTVTGKYTGEQIPAEFKNGVLSFDGEKGKEYSISLKHKDYQATSEKLFVPLEATAVEKTSFVLQENLKKDKNSLPVIIAIDDKEGITINDVNVIVLEKGTGKQIPAQINDGNLTFNGQKGKEYTITADHKDYQPTLKKIKIPTQAKQVNKTTLTLVKKANTVPILATIADESGNVLRDATATVTEKETGKQIPTQVTEGILSFMGDQGKEYTISVDHQDYNPASEQFVIPEQTTGSEKTDIVLAKKTQGKLPISLSIADDNGNPLTGANVIIHEKETGGTVQAQMINGELTFNGEKGKEYTITVDHANYNQASKQFVVPTQATGTEKAKIILTKKSPATLPISIDIIDSKGNILNDAAVIVEEKETGQQIQAKLIDGVLLFTGEKGKEYTINVDHKDYSPASKQFVVPTQETETGKVNIILDKASKKSIPVVANIVDSKGNPLKDANVTVIEKETGKQIQTQLVDGILTFNGEKGKEYAINVNHKDYNPASTLFRVPEAIETEKVDIVLEGKSTENSTHIVTTIVDSEGNPLADASVTIFDRKTGQQVPSKLTNSILSFEGEKGKDYTLLVKHKDYIPATEQFTVPIQSTKEENVAIALTKRSIVQPALKMAARIFKTVLNQALSNADVKIVSFSEPDIDLQANNDGVVEFILPKGTDYILIANKDSYTGMHSGTAEQGKDMASIIHEVPAYNDAPKKIPVIGVATDENGNMIQEIKVTVVNKATGERLQTNVENGFISFLSERGNSYKVETTADGFVTQVSNITIDPLDPNAHKLVINLSSTKKKSTVDSHLIVIKNADKTSRYYISTSNTHYEIFEKEGTLYLQDDAETKSLGKGTLLGINAKVDSIITSLGLSSTETITIENIYFDHNKSQLDDADKIELDKLNAIMRLYPSLRLNIAAHADDRGSDHYNMNLSKKRAKAIVSYLVKRDINKNRIIEESYGESIPAVPCLTIDCTEEERQKNRRAEFAFNSTKNNQAPIKPIKVIDKPLVKESRNDYADKIEKYGDRALDSLTFKISIGAYRYNSTLTFNELNDLGSVEIIFLDGITYYYLSEYRTLKEMEKIRQQVIKRGVKDASFIILYKGNKIPFSAFVSLTNSQQ